VKNFLSNVSIFILPFFKNLKTQELINTAMSVSAIIVFKKNNTIKKQCWKWATTLKLFRPLINYVTQWATVHITECPVHPSLIFSRLRTYT